MEGGGGGGGGGGKEGKCSSPPPFLEGERGRQALESALVHAHVHLAVVCTAHMQHMTLGRTLDTDGLASSKLRLIAYTIENYTLLSLPRTPTTTLAT